MTAARVLLALPAYATEPQSWTATHPTVQRWQQPTDEPLEGYVPRLPGGAPEVDEAVPFAERMAQARDMVWGPGGYVPGLVRWLQLDAPGAGE